MARLHDSDVAGPPGSSADPAPSSPDRSRHEWDHLLGEVADRVREVLVGNGGPTLDVVGRGGAPPRGTSGVLDVPAREHQVDVPIEVRGELVGSLRVADTTRGGFGLARALAATAGLALEKARLYEAARQREGLLQASAAVTRQLLAGGEGADHPLELVARGSRDVAAADVVALLRVQSDGLGPPALFVDVLVAADDVVRAGPPVPVEGSWLGRVCREGRSARLGGDEITRLAPAPWIGVDVGAVLATPLVGSRTAHGLLCAARLPGRAEFTSTDVELVAGLANQAAVAIELAEARAEQQRAVVLDERERIAADLHDSVVQRLFGIGLSLQGVLGGLRDERAAERLRGIVDEVDRTINRIRGMLFPLQASESAPAPDPRDRVLDTVAELVPVLGLEPDLRFSGLLTAPVSADLVEDLVAVVRLALLDVARRGRATVVSVDLVQDRDGLVVHVRDDDPQAADAVTDEVDADLRRRAARHGGTLTVSAGTPVGTSLYWWASRS